MFPGPFCEKHRLSKNLILNSSENILPIIGLQNGLVLELRVFLNKCGKSESELIKILTLIDPRLSVVNAGALRSKLNRLCEQRKKLSHKKKVPGFKDAADLLHRQFDPPEITTTAATVNIEPMASLTETISRSTDINSVHSVQPADCTVNNFKLIDNNNDSCEKLENHIDSAVNTDRLPISDNSDTHLESAGLSQSPLSVEFEHSERDVNVLKYQYNKLNKKNKNVEMQISQKLDKLSALEARIGHYAVKNVNKRDETAKKNLSLLRSSERSVRQLKNLLSKTESKYQQCEKHINEIKTEKKELHDRLVKMENLEVLHEQENKKKISAQKNASYLRSEIKRLKSEAHENVNDEINDLKSIIRMREYEIEDLQMEIADIQERLRMQFQTKNVDGSYNDNIRLCVLELAGLEVAV